VVLASFVVDAESCVAVMSIACCPPPVVPVLFTPSIGTVCCCWLLAVGLPCIAIVLWKEPSCGSVETMDMICSSLQTLDFEKHTVFAGASAWSV